MKKLHILAKQIKVAAEEDKPPLDLEEAQDPAWSWMSQEKEEGESKESFLSQPLWLHNQLLGHS